MSIPEHDLRLALAALERGLVRAPELIDLVWRLARSERPTNLARLLLEAGHVDLETLAGLRAAVAAEPTVTAVYGADLTAVSAPPGATDPTTEGTGSDMEALRTLGLDGARFERRYVPGEEIGRGGVGRVVSYHDRLMGRTVAIKALHEGAQAGPQRARFLAEARTTARLEHPNVVPVYDLGTLPDGAPCFTMKRVRGRSLKEILVARERGDDAGSAERLTLFRLLQILGQVCMAVDYAHSLGVLHRDLKPENIMVGDFGEVFVMDWGIAKVRGDGADAGPQPGGRPSILETVDGGPALTQAGTIFGTPGYMPPEQAAGRTDEIGPPTDVWALGAILYEVLTGRRTYEGRSPLAVLMATLQQDVVPPRRRTPERDIPPDLEEICLRALARDAADRYPSARALHADIERFLTGARERERRAREADRLVEEGRETRWYLSTLAEELGAVRERLAHMPRPSATEPLEAKRERWQLEDRAAALDRERLQAFRWAEGKLLRAVELVPRHAEARRELAELHWSRYREAREAFDGPAAEEHLEAVARWDDGAFSAVLEPTVPLDLTTDPPGAEVVLHRYRERDRILVPVADRSLGRTPLRRVPVPVGPHLLELRPPDRRPVRLPIMSWRGDELRFDVPLPTDAELGDDFVFVPAGHYLRGNDRDALMPLPAARVPVAAFAIARLRVTLAEYFEFLADLPPDEARRRAPHDKLGNLMVFPEAGGHWTLPARDIDGDRWEPDWPVMHVSFDDAEAYCAWRSRRDGARYRLPSEDEWEKAARGTDGRLYPWGDHFDPTFCLMRESGPGEPDLRPVGSFPTDESPYGIRDMAGGVRDWTTSWFEPGRRVIRGGAWNLYGDFSRAASRWGMAPWQALPNIGFRLVKDLG